VGPEQIDGQTPYCYTDPVSVLYCAFVRHVTGNSEALCCLFQYIPSDITPTSDRQHGHRQTQGYS